MFKNMLKRAWLSTIRKPTRSIILAVLFFVMANMILATIVIQSSVNQSVQYAKETLGGIVYLQPDMEALREQAITNRTPGQPIVMRMIRPSVPIETVKQIADSEYVKDYSYSVNARAETNGFDPIEGDGNQPFNISSGGVARGPAGNISIQGINSFAFIPGAESGDVKLIEGAIFDESTNNSVIISYDLADANGLKVGDKIKLNTVSMMIEDFESTTIELSIIGIYDTTSENTDSNTIYMNTETAAQFSPDEDGNIVANYGVQGVKYYLTSAEYKDAFITEANAKYPTLKNDNLVLSIDDTAYQQMAGPIESVGAFATVILIVVIIASIVIITLIVTINIKDRRYEMGVLLSLGAPKSNIIGQILLELVAVGTVGLILSVGTSSYLAQAMGNNMLESQIAMNEQRSQQNYGRGISASGPGMVAHQAGPGGGGKMSFGAFSDAEAIDEININATLSDYIILFTSTYAIIIFSLVIPSISILRYQPKTILTGKE